MRRLVIGLGLLALVAGTWSLLGATRRDDTAPQWLTTAVDRGPITAAVTATGAVSASTSVDVGTYVSGPIQAIFADYNTPVTKGQLLARIDPRPFQVKVDAARASVTNARAKLEKDKADAALKAATLRRTRALRADGVVSANDLDTAQSAALQAAAQIALSEAEIVSAEARQQEAEVNLAYTEIVSPITGVVVARNVSTGQTVAATFQTPTLFLVAGDLRKMIVAASVSESDIGVVAVGQAVTFTVDAYPGQPFLGTVSQVRNAPVTVQNVVTYDVIVTVDNAELKLKPGMTANVTITTAERTGALRVPQGALRFRPPGDNSARPAGPRVWRPDAAGTPESVTIATGVSDDRFVEVTSGLSEGDLVITGMQNPVTPGTPQTRGPGFLPGGGGRRMR